MTATASACLGAIYLYLWLLIGVVMLRAALGEENGGLARAALVLQVFLGLHA